MKRGFSVLVWIAIGTLANIPIMQVCQLVDRMFLSFRFGAGNAMAWDLCRRIRRGNFGCFLTLKKRNKRNKGNQQAITGFRGVPFVGTDRNVPLLCVFQRTQAGRNLKRLCAIGPHALGPSGHPHPIRVMRQFNVRAGGHPKNLFRFRRGHENTCPPKR
jgi:hypothetical protein